MINNEYPELVLESFPIIKDMIFVRQLASLTPFAPDTTFDIYMTDSRDYFALVTTDYADPYDQSHELKGISDQYAIEFTNLVKPFDNAATITILLHDEIDDAFFVTAPYKNYKFYYYLARLKVNSAS